MKRLLQCLLLLPAVLTGQPAAKPFFLWMDAHANIGRLNSVGGIRRVMDSARSVGVTDVVIDGKPIDGFVTYRSRIAPQLVEWQGAKRSPDFPFIETMMREARWRGMRAHLSLNVFAEGHKAFKIGGAYRDSTVRSWAVTVYSKSGLKSILDTDEEIAVFVNPVLSAVREYELGIIEEVARMFHPDGIVLDRCRYAGIRTDFSDSSRAVFEHWLGRRVERWPYDIITVDAGVEGSTDYVRGPLFKEWVEWRASVIAGFIREARARVKAIDPAVKFGDYVGAWYPSYFEVGVNWASREFDPSAAYDWATPTYRATGYADDLDFLMAGTYFYEVTTDELLSASSGVRRTEAAQKIGKEPWYSVEGSADLAMRVTAGSTPVYGSVYAEQYKERDNPEQFVRAIRMTRRRTNGLMIFDLVHVDRYGWWKYIRSAGSEGP